MRPARGLLFETGGPLAVAALGIAVFWLILEPRALDSPFGKPSLYGLDLHGYFLPKYAYGNEELLAGRIPLWNRFEYAGIPFLATSQPAVFYPPKIMAFALFGPDRALSVLLAAHYALLALGFAVLARRLGIGPLGTFAGIAAFTFNMMVLRSNTHPIRVENVVWMPFVFLCVDRLLRGAGPRWLALLAACAALQFAVGAPNAVFEVALLTAVWAAAGWAADRTSPPPWRSIPLLAAGFALGAALAAVQILPTIDLAVYSQRTAQAARESAGFLPFLKPIPVLASALAVFAPAALLGRRAAGPVACLAVCLLLGSGGFLVLRAVPGYSMVRHGFNWMIFMHFFLAASIALGADAFARTSGRTGRARATRAIVAVGALAWAGLCLAVLVAPADGPRMLLENTVVKRQLAGLDGGTITRALGLAGGLLLAAAAFFPGRARAALSWTATVALSASVLAAYPHGEPVEELRPPTAPGSVAAFLGGSPSRIEGRVFSVPDIRAGRQFFDRVENLFGSEHSFRPPRFAGVQDVFHRSSLWRWKALADARGFLDVLDVEYVVAPSSARARIEESGLRWIERRGFNALYRNADRMPRAWVGYGVTVRPPEEALERLLSPEFDPREEVMLERAPRRRYPSIAPYPPTPADVRRVTPNRVEVEVEIPRPGILVLSEAFFPGWEVAIDGSPGEILCADHVLRGVELEAGRHVARFDYRPGSFRAGAIVTALAAALWLGAVLLPGRWGFGPSPGGSS